MAQYVALNKQVEVNGSTVLSVVAGSLDQEAGWKALAEEGIQEVKPEGWYNQQQWLNAFKRLEEKVGVSALYLIGLKIPESAQFPPQIQTLEQALSAIDVAYHMNHRLDGKPLFDPATGVMTEGIGHYSARIVGPRHIQVSCDNPYPCDFDRGIIEAMAKRFRPKEGVLAVIHEDKMGCRKKGNGTCVYNVRW
jgi:hypothetical protein